VPVHRYNDPAEAFLLHRAKKIARIFSPAQTTFCDRGCIKSAFECEARFFRGVIESADYEVFTVMSLRALRQPFVLIRKPLDNFRPRNVRSEFGTGENTEGRDPSDQVPKSDSIEQPIKTSMGSRFHSYS
jgi:hypothetical protein